MDADLADKIRMRMKDRQLTQNDVALQMGVDQPRISEALNPDIDTRMSMVVKIADQLDCDVCLVPRELIAYMTPH